MNKSAAKITFFAPKCMKTLQKLRLNGHTSFEFQELLYVFYALVFRYKEDIFTSGA